MLPRFAALDVGDIRRAASVPSRQRVDRFPAAPDSFNVLRLELGAMVFFTMHGIERRGHHDTAINSRTIATTTQASAGYQSEIIVVILLP
jgi:hypothetical protein